MLFLMSTTSQTDTAKFSGEYSHCTSSALASGMLVPEAAMDEDHGFVFR